LHLAWTSKALRALLLNRSSASIWKQTFHNLPFPQPPKCPDDLNEPQYAELLFRKACHVCYHIHSSSFSTNRVRSLSSSVTRVSVPSTSRGQHDSDHARNAWIYSKSHPTNDSSPSTPHTRSLISSLQETGFEMKPYGPALQRLLPKIQLKKKYGMHSMVLNKPTLSLLYLQGHIGEGRRLFAQRLTATGSTNMRASTPPLLSDSG